jgi:lipid-A-disaccharide synthase
MLVILPFEVDFYRQYGMNVHFVGHPLIDAVKPSMSSADALALCGFEEDAQLIALLPGSRSIELKLHLPHLCRAAEILYAADKKRRFVIPAANSLSPDRARRAAQRANAPISVVSGHTYDCVSAARCAVVAAGTATLETALLGAPEIIIGRVGRLTWILWSRHTHLPYYGLPNYILGEKLITELIQSQATGEEIARRIEQLLASREERERLKEGYSRIRERLGAGGASERAAQAALAILSGETKAYALVGKDK